MTVAEVNEGVNVVLKRSAGGLHPRFMFRILMKVSQVTKTKLKETASADFRHSWSSSYVAAVGVWSDKKAFQHDEPTLSAIPVMSMVKKITWMNEQLIDDLVVPLLLGGEEKEVVVLKIVEHFLQKFESASAVSGDADHMHLLLQTITGMRCIAACGSRDIWEQAENIDDVITTWAECGKGRTVLASIAGAIGATPHWLGKLRPLIDSPGAYKEAGPKLQETVELLAASSGADEKALQTLDKVTRNFVEIQGLVGEAAMASHNEKLWRSISSFWEKYKAESEQSSITIACLSAVMKYFSYADLLFAHKQSLHDFVGEASSINLSRDGEVRTKELLKYFDFIAQADVEWQLRENVLTVATWFRQLHEAINAAKGMPIKIPKHVDDFMSRCTQILDLTIAGNGKLPADIEGTFVTLSASQLGDFKVLGTWVTALERGVACSDFQTKLETIVSEAGIDSGVLIADDYCVLREAALTTKKLAEALENIPLASAGKACLLQKHEALQAYIGSTQKQLSKFILERVKVSMSAVKVLANDPEGAAWSTALNQKWPWPKFLDHYSSTLAKYDISRLQGSIDDYNANRSQYTAACSAFAIQEPDGIDCTEDMEKLMVAVAAKGIMNTITSETATDKNQLRTEVIKKLAILRKASDPAREPGLEHDLPIQLRQKIERALLWKSIK